ncbi:MAG: polyhydroxyalkanoate depolymerase, partial [Alphaproteobacteria bacterium]|nr:polyhydroxyalkanoate depolymerase [Alphaproteobacteria bacterium]
MLYALHEMQRLAWAPARMMAEAGRQAASNPLHPMSWHPAGRAVGAACELFERASRKHGKPEFAIRQVLSGGVPVAVREEVVVSKPFCDLLHFRREGRTGDPAVLVVAPLSGHFATLLRDTVRGLLAEHDVYITDWQDARQVPAGRGPFTLDDYIDTLLEFLARLGPEAHLVAVCQPSV